MRLALLLILSILCGVLLVTLLICGWRWLKHYQELIAIRERLLSKEQEIAEQNKRMDVFKEEIGLKFDQLAQQTLKGSNQEFLKMAEITLKNYQEQSVSRFDSKKMEIQNIVSPLQEALGQFQKEVNNMERERQRSYAVVENEIKKVVENSATLSKETRALKDALKKPHIRGRWGEVQLKNCVELAGMSEFSDVLFQDANVEDGKKLIPDMTVKMPGGRVVVVDAKTPLDGFLESLEADSDQVKNEEMVRHGKQVREHVVKLSRKSYGDLLKESADFTVMFLPNESFLYAALETQPDLVEFALEKKILIATPPTFVGLLKVIRFGWNEERLNQNAEEISKIGKELHKRVTDFMESYFQIGKSLKTAQENYETGLNRLKSRVLVQAKKMEKLGAKSHKDLPTMDH